LVIEDEEIVRGVLRRMLSIDGHEVIDAADGETGLERYRIAAPDIVFVDLLMPAMSGYDVIEALRQRDPAAKIVAMTAVGEAALRIAEEKGADGSLLKPFRISSVLRIVRDLARVNR
jgi:CheY-like chemotaxis protein